MLVDADNTSECGIVGLDKLSDATGELRRRCLIPSLRRQRWVTKMFRILKEQAVKVGLKIFCSTPKHGTDVVEILEEFRFC